MKNIIELLIMWMCSKGKHRFIAYQRHDKGTVYFLRGCKYCGFTELRHAGPCGDGKWHDVREFSKWPWEKESFLRSIIVID